MRSRLVNHTASRKRGRPVVPRLVPTKTFLRTIDACGRSHNVTHAQLQKAAAVCSDRVAAHVKPRKSGSTSMVV
jgi:hypothetical protein